MDTMNPARQAFEDELRQLLTNAIANPDWTLDHLFDRAADRLIELARRVINEE